jgi:hypothetical protein
MNLHPSHALKSLLLTLLATAAGSASANPVVYTLRTVADGQIGTHVFSEALVIFQMKADTANIATRPSAFNGGIVFTNTGETTVTIVDGTQIIFATFTDPLTVRYDTGAGIAGFGSSISPTYPIALNCSQTQDCPNPGDAGSDGSGTLGVLLGLPPNEGSASQEALSLPASLAMTTLLTGAAFTCAGAYTIANPASFPFTQTLEVCGAPAALPLRTSRGGFYLQDQIGGSTSDPLPADRPAQAWFGWDLANYGSLHVEVGMSEGE